jgi:hypothetical protein
MIRGCHETSRSRRVSRLSNSGTRLFVSRAFFLRQRPLVDFRTVVTVRQACWPCGPFWGCTPDDLRVVVRVAQAKESDRAPQGTASLGRNPTLESPQPIAAACRSGRTPTFCYVKRAPTMSLLTITLPDGSQQQVAAGTTPLDVAKSIGTRLAADRRRCPGPDPDQ